MFINNSYLLYILNLFYLPDTFYVDICILWSFWLLRLYFILFNIIFKFNRLTNGGILKLYKNLSILEPLKINFWRVPVLRVFNFFWYKAYGSYQYSENRFKQHNFFSSTTVDVIFVMYNPLTTKMYNYLLFFSHQWSQSVRRSRKNVLVFNFIKYKNLYLYFYVTSNACKLIHLHLTYQFCLVIPIFSLYSMLCSFFQSKI